MDITVTEQDNVKIIGLEGDLDTGTSPQALSGILGKGAARLVLDMEKIDYISSAGPQAGNSGFTVLIQWPGRCVISRVSALSSISSRQGRMPLKGCDRARALPYLFVI